MTPTQEPPIPAPSANPADQANYFIRPQVGEEMPGLVWSEVTPERGRQILANAMGGDLQAQHELFGIMIDTWPRLAKALGEVSGAVRRLAWQVEPVARRGEESTPEAQAHADLVEAALRSWRPEVGSLDLSFEDSIDQLLDARARGVSVLELVWQTTPEGILPRASQWLTPRHYGWDRAGRTLGLLHEPALRSIQRSGRANWSPFIPDKFLVGFWRARAGAPGPTALLRPLVPYWIGRTYGWKWLLRTAQIFGVPFRWANYDATRPDVGQQVADMLKNLGAAGWAAFPTGTTLEFKEAVANARDNPQALLQELADQACDLLVLGQTLSGTSQAAGLGSGTAALHGSVRQEVLQAAAWWVADVLNYQLVPAVIRLNYGQAPAALPRVSPDLSLPTDPKALADRDAVLRTMGLRLPEDWLYERHGVPQPKGDEPALGTGATPAGETPGAAGADSWPNLTSIDRQGVPTPVRAANGPPGLFAGIRGASGEQAQDTGKPTERFFEDLTGVTADWLAPVEPILRRLLALAEADAATSADVEAALAEVRKALPEIFTEVDHEEMAGALRRAFAAEVVNGAAVGIASRKP